MYVVYSVREFILHCSRNGVHHIPRTLFAQYALIARVHASGIVVIHVIPCLHTVQSMAPNVSNAGSRIHEGASVTHAMIGRALAMAAICLSMP